MIKTNNLTILKNFSLDNFNKNLIESLDEYNPIQCLFPNIDTNINILIDNISSQINKHFTLINNNKKELLGLLWHIKENRYLFVAANNYDNRIHFKKNLDDLTIEEFLKNSINSYLVGKIPTRLENSLNINKEIKDISFIYKARKENLQIQIKKDHRKLLQILQQMAEKKKELTTLENFNSSSMPLNSLEVDEEVKKSLQVANNTILWHAPMQNAIIADGGERTKELSKIRFPEAIIKIHIDKFNLSTYNLFSVTSHNQYIEDRYGENQLNPHIMNKSKNSKVNNLGCLGSFDKSFKEAKEEINLSYMIDLANNYRLTYNADDHTPLSVTHFKDMFEPIIDEPIKMIKIPKNPKPAPKPENIDSGTFNLDDLDF